MYKEIQGELEKIRRKYLDSAEEIVSGYNRECTLSKDYEGRQMFELLQNADDESAGSTGKVLITFDGKTLSVSNTGEPFSFRGVKSLLYPNASPKKIHANKIGCKGLGFRSILTWANSVTVASKDFTIQFSKDYAQEFLASILEEKPELKSEIQALSLDPWPIATLTCPHVLEESALVDGYSTSIIIECREDLSDTIVEQIEGLEFEELVFLPNLKQIEIQCMDYHRNFFKVSEGNEVIIETEDVNSGETDCASWKLFRKTGIVEDENGNDKDYEFIVAYDPSGERQGEVLYSYFKTDVKLGFPALIHGTFELNSDRNSLQKNSRINQQLIPLLADFMVQCAVAISEEQRECNYAPLKLIITSEMDYVLQNVFKLDLLLREKAREQRILPSIGNKYISVLDDPKYSDEAFDAVLNPSVFPTMLKCVEHGYDYIENYIQNELDIDFYDFTEFCRLINKTVDDYSIEQRVELVYLTKREFTVCGNDSYPHLLIDSNGKNILDNSKVYPLPNEEQVISLPQWVDIRFLNPAMEKMLFERLSINNTRRELANALSWFNLEEYSFDRLLRGVVNQVDDEVDSAEKCSDILRWLWSYYDREDCQPIPDVKVKVICRDGEIRYARNCYIGSEYGNELGERLISKYSDKFIAFERLGLQCVDATNVAGFLEWLGASKYPRFEKKTLSPEEKKPFVSTCYPLYVQRDNCYYSSTDFSNIRMVTVGFFESLDILLEQANFNDLVAWFLLDDEINGRIYSESEEKNPSSCITGRPTKKVDERKVAPANIKSYLRYYLTTTSWIPNIDGVKAVPAYCCFEDNQLAPFIIVPAVDYTYLKSVVGRNCKKDIDALLSRIGVADVFQEMENHVIYETLLQLPALDKDCKRGKSIYRRIIRDGLTPEEYKENNPAYNEFIKSGLVLARKDGQKMYVPVSEARYADKKVFSEEMLRSFSMFDADSRSGEEKIKKLFGVKPLKYTNVETEGAPELHPLDESFRKEYIRFIPFVYACRIGLKNAATDFRRLKSSKVVLCSKITIKYRFGDDTRISSMTDFESVYLRKSNTAYICVPRRYSAWESLKSEFHFADAVAEMITSILDVNEDKEFYRDLFRENDAIREMKMRNDKNDDNLELLSSARKRFNSDINLRDEFWMAMAQLMHISDPEDSTADSLMVKMQLDPSVDANIDYKDINLISNAESLISIFKSLGLDVDKYNAISIHAIDISNYWVNKLKEKMHRYKKKYQAYLYADLNGNNDCVELYDRYLEDFSFLEPGINNSVNVDIDETFEEETGVSFDMLDEYSETEIEDIIRQAKEEVDTDTWMMLCKSYPAETIEAYLIFGKMEELLTKDEEVGKEPENHSPAQSLKGLVRDVFAMPTTGFADVNTQAGSEEPEQTTSGKHHKHYKRVHSETSDLKKQEIGIVGEAYVYRGLLKLYPDARWISGNAEKAGIALKGDDTCGYDIKYTDGNGVIQYVEVKASRNDEITFILSDNELRFACKNASCYEVIYVVIGDDGRLAHDPWRLGHLFELAEGEDLLHNDRFSIESDSYSVTAKPIAQKS